MTTFQHVSLIEVTRGEIVESVHYGSLCLRSADGSILFSLGDMSAPFFLRSAAKPFQALAFLEQGGADHYQLEPQEIAILCSSHSGTSAHIEVLEKLQKKVGIYESMLQCGIHAPYHQASADQLKREGKTPRPNHNNCSGKHTGMLSFAKMIGASLDNYLEASHSVQQAMLNTFSEMCAVDKSTVILGVDGCTAPVYAVPLPAAALAYARLCQPESLPPMRAAACRAITSAMLTHTDMVAGPERFDTDGMLVGRGAFISKLGAEGYRAIGIMPGAARNLNKSLGLTIKVSDGDRANRATSLIAISVLRALGILDEAQAEFLKQYDRRPIINWQGIEVGEIRPSEELMDALAELEVNS